jgi:ribosomal protein S14
MKLSTNEKYKGKGKRLCRNCGNARALIRKYKLFVCRRYVDW